MTFNIYACYWDGIHSRVLIGLLWFNLIHYSSFVSELFNLIENSYVCVYFCVKFFLKNNHMKIMDNTISIMKGNHMATIKLVLYCQ